MAFKLKPEEKKNEPPGALETGLRTGLQATTGALSALPGSFGNLLKGINDIAAAPITKAITGSSIPYEETSVGKLIPPTEKHIQHAEEKFPYLKPKNKVEKFIRDIAKDTTELFLPGRYFKMGRYALSPLRSLGISVGANTSGEAVTQFTGDESKGNKVKSLMMLVGALVNPMGAKDVVKDLYQKASNALPQGAQTSTATLNRNLTDLADKILKKRSYSQLADSEKFVIDEIMKVAQSTRSGRVDVSTLSALKTSLNENLQKAVFDIRDPSGRGRAKHLAKVINGQLREAMEEYGRINPQWWKLQKAADQASGAVQQSNYISRGLEKLMKGRSEGLAQLFGIALPAGVSLFSPVTGGIGIAAYQAAKIGTRFARSKELQKHYGKVVGAALADNPKAAQKELDEIEKELKKEKKKKYRLKS